MAELRKRHTEAAAAAEDSDKGQELDSDPVSIENLNSCANITIPFTDWYVF